MSQIIFGLIFFLLGYFYHKNKKTEEYKKYLFSTSKLLEINFYIVLKEFMEMHNYGMLALNMTLEKCGSDNPDMRQEYEKIIELYNKKFEQFGEHYFSTMKNIFPYELKYKTYKEVKEVFDNLINKK